MNFYDGRNGRTLFLPSKKICEVLHLFGLELERYAFYATLYTKVFIQDLTFGEPHRMTEGKTAMRCADLTKQMR
jgi:hypothetical protein